MYNAQSIQIYSIEQSVYSSRSCRSKAKIIAASWSTSAASGLILSQWIKVCRSLPSQSNAIESAHRYLEEQEFMRSQLPIGQFVNFCKGLIEHWSRKQDPNREARAIDENHEKPAKDGRKRLVHRKIMEFVEQRCVTEGGFIYVPVGAYQSITMRQVKDRARASD